MERRVDPVVLVAFGLACGPLLALSPLATALAASGLLLLLWRQRACVLVALLLVALGAVRARDALIAGRSHYQQTVAQVAPSRRCAGLATVLRSPIVLRGPKGPAPGNDARIDVHFASADCEGRPVDDLRVRLYGAPRDLGRGDRVELIADVAPVRLFDNGDDPEVRLALTGVAASGGVIDAQLHERGAGWWRATDHARYKVRERIEASYPEDVAPLARALVLGETDLASGESEAFRRSGLAHLLAVSGTHLVIAVLALGRLLRALLLRISALSERVDVGVVVALVCVPLSWAYADFAGGGGSAYRAAGMLTVAMLARALGRRPCGLRAFAWSLLGGALVEPLAICDLSFALSVAATGGLLWTQDAIVRVTEQRARPLRWLLRAALATTAATVACAPLLLRMGPSLPLLGVAANVLAAPIGELCALPLCLLHTVLGWWPAAERGAAVVATGALLWVRAVAHAADGPPLTLPPPTCWQIASGVLALSGAWLAASWRSRMRRGLCGVLAIGLFEVLAMRLGAPRDVLRITAIDVGQGDALLIDLPDGRAMLVDGGGFVGSPLDVGERALLPLLRRRRRGRLDVMVLSHPHPDHYKGLVSVARHVEVGQLWDNGTSRGNAGAGQLVAALGRAGTVVRNPGQLCDRQHRFGGATVDVLAPCPAAVPLRRANDNSLVLRIRFGKRRALLTGDAEQEQEHDLLDEADLRADFLKVGHHGSRTSSGARFIAAVRPGWALISCGIRNRFGHPALSTLTTLRQNGAVVWRTDWHGAVEWQTDGSEVRVRGSP